MSVTLRSVSVLALDCERVVVWVLMRVLVAVVCEVTTGTEVEVTDLHRKTRELFCADHVH